MERHRATAATQPCNTGKRVLPQLCSSPQGPRLGGRNHGAGPELFSFLFKGVQRTGLCLLLLLVKYLGCWLSPSPAIGFCFLLSHDSIVALQPLRPSDTQGCALLTKFPARIHFIHFIFLFPVQLFEKLLLCSVTTFASLDIFFIFICFLLLYVFSCFFVGSITGQEVARHFYHIHISNWDLLGSMGHCLSEEGVGI